MVYLEIRRWELNAFTCANKKTDKGTMEFASNKNGTIYALAHTERTTGEPIKGTNFKNFSYSLIVKLLLGTSMYHLLHF